MDIESSPGTVIAIPIKFANVSVLGRLMSVAMLGNHSPLPAWRNDDRGGCSVCGVGHDVPRNISSYSRLAEHKVNQHLGCRYT